MRRWLLIWALLLSVAAAGQQKRALPRGADYPFQDGEKMTYSLMYKWGAVVTQIGTGWLQLDSTVFNGIPCYHTELSLKTAPFFDLFFKIREDFHSWFAVDDLRPLKFTRDTYEGGYTATNTYLYDWEKEVINADINFEGRGPQKLEIPLRDGVSDLPTLVYALRATDFSKMEAGRVYSLKFAIDDDVYDVNLKYQGLETLKVRKLGKTRVHHFSCSVVQGALFEGNQDLQFWMSADEARLLVGLMAPLRMGAMWAWVSAPENLKYPFSAVQQ
jgi:hypothetical protein